MASKTTTEFRPSSLADWKKSSTIDVVLGSGAHVTIRPLTLDELAADHVSTVAS